MQPPAQGLWQKKHIVAFGLLAMATSGFGQTFFIAVFGAEIRSAFALSHTAYGTIYSLATVISAGLLLHAGTWVDRWPLPRVTSAAILFLALGCVLIGLAPHVAVLALGMLLIRFGGQGLIAHVGITTVARFFTASRGKAVALSAAGMPIAEASLPVAGVLIIGLVGWRAPWLIGAVVLLLIALPVLVQLSRHTGPAPRVIDRENDDAWIPRDFTRAEALRDPGLYMLLPAVLASPFIVTAVLFHQAAIAEARGWSLELVATAFVGFAAGHLCSLIAAGPVVDRIGAQRTLPLALLPITAGLVVLTLGTGTWAAFAYLALTGTTLGGVATVGGAIWAERYGTRHLGAIRAVAQATMVLSTAIAPIVLGLALDLGWTVTAIAGGLTLATAFAGALAATAPAPKGRAG